MKTILENTANELVIKNSKFITILHSIDDNTDINKLLENYKEKYPKATHYCYGYITENKKKSSDDGEPGGTAGTPILNVLEKENIINVIAIVIRYFGGIKLGAGGLVRAYSKSIKEALNNSNLIELEEGYQVEITFDYDNKKDLDYKLKNYEIINEEYLDKIKYTILIPINNIDKINNYNYKIINKLLIKKQKI